MQVYEDLKFSTIPGDQSCSINSSKDLFLESKGTCFLCLQGKTKSSSFVNSNEFDEDVCFVSICRYLNINSSSVLRNSLKGEGKPATACPPREQFNFSVSLCSRCASITKKLSKLIQEVEKMQMEMNHHLQEFHKILKTSDQELQNHFSDMISENDTPRESSIMELLRLETKKKCSIRVQQLHESRLPKVILCRIDRGDERKPAVISSDAPATMNSNSVDRAIGNETFKAKSINGSYDEMVLETSSIQMMCHPNESSSTHENLSAEDISENDDQDQQALISQIFAAYCNKLKNGNKFECTICKKRFKWAARTRQHLASVHPERLLSDARLPDCSMMMFRECCKRILQAETYHSRQCSGSGTSPPNQAIFCLHCSKKCFNGHYLRYHMVLEHYDVLKRKLIRHQREITGRLKKRPQLSQNRQGNGPSIIVCHKCGDCGKGFSHHWLLTRHKRDLCPSNINSRRICEISGGGCGRRFSSDFCLARHKKEACTRSKDTLVIDRSWEKRTCGGCGSKFRSVDKLLIHKKHNRLCQNQGMSYRLKDSQEVVLSGPPKGITVPTAKEEIRDEEETEEWDKETFESVTCWCGEPFQGRAMIECEKCLVWYHMSCEQIHPSKSNDPIRFMCRKCRQSGSGRTGEP